MPRSSSCRIGTVDETLLQLGVRRLARRFKDATVNIEQPAVIATPDAVHRHDPEFERRAAVRTVPVQEADLSGLVPKDDQILTQYADRERQIAKLLRQAHRLPEATHQFTARRARPDMC